MFKTLLDAVILVAIVVLLFLQDWKAVMLPLIDVAVSLVGTFAVMKLMGFTLNNLTLFGLVLAIGIVVDDAIVVLENIERWLAKGLSVARRDHQGDGRDHRTDHRHHAGAGAVFLPSAFLGGITGQFFRQFALTIAVSMIISAINAMTMTPARAAAIFARPQARGTGPTMAARRCRGGSSAWSAGWLESVFSGRSRPAFGLVGGRKCSRPGTVRLMAATYGIAAALFVPAAVAGGVVGWIIIRPVNWLLGLVLPRLQRRL